MSEWEHLVMGYEFSLPVDAEEDDAIHAYIGSDGAAALLKSKVASRRLAFQLRGLTLISNPGANVAMFRAEYFEPVPMP